MDVDDTEVLALVRAVEAQDGRPVREWKITPVGDLGWVLGAIGVRSNVGYAVTPAGRIGRFMLSTTRDIDALTTLAALPIPTTPPEVLDGAAAEQVVEVALAGIGSLGHTGWQHVEIGDLGWRLTPTGLASDLHFVVTRTGQVALAPATDVSGEATLRELAARSVGRIPVAQISP